MSLFSNQNFMNQIIHESGCAKLPEDVTAMLQTLVEIETRKLVQQAGKFARNDRRDQIDFEDIQIGSAEIGHPEFTFVDQEQQYIRSGSSYIRRDPIYKSGKQLIEEELKSLSINFTALPKLRAHWVYIEGKIPKTNDNRTLKSKTQILSIRQKQIGEKNKKFNIIMDQPQSMLTGFQLQYYRDVTSILSDSDSTMAKLQDIDIQGNLSNLFPLFLKYLLNSDITDTKMIYFLSLLNNKYIRSSSQFHLHQILTYLCAYEGQISYKVGEKLGELIKRFGQKYPYLRNVWVQNPNKTESLINQQSRNTAYNNAIKKIAIQIATGIPINISNKLLERMEEDVLKQNKHAILCKQIVTEYAGRIGCLRAYGPNELYWIPNQYDSEKAGYMMMNL